MANYDIAIGTNKSGINNALTALHSKPDIYEKYFKGKVNIELPDFKDIFYWDISQPPSVTLSAPSEDKWDVSIGPDGMPVKKGSMPTVNMFQLELPSLVIKYKIDAEEVVSTISRLCIYADINVSGDKSYAFINPQAIYEEESNLKPIEKIMFNIAVPEVFKALSNAFAHFDLPSTTQTIFEVQISFTSIVLSVGNGFFVLAASADNNPLDITGASWPSDVEAFMLVRPEFLTERFRQKVESEAKSQINKGKQTGQSGKVDWSYNIILNNLVSLTAHNDDATKVNCKVSISASAEASVLDGACSLGAATDAL